MIGGFGALPLAVSAPKRASRPDWLGTSACWLSALYPNIRRPGHGTGFWRITPA